MRNENLGAAFKKFMDLDSPQEKSASMESFVKFLANVMSDESKTNLAIEARKEMPQEMLDVIMGALSAKIKKVLARDGYEVIPLSGTINVFLNDIILHFSKTYEVYQDSRTIVVVGDEKGREKLLADLDRSEGSAAEALAEVQTTLTEVQTMLTEVQTLKAMVRAKSKS